MAIDTEFIDFIVPIASIKENYPGGWAQCLSYGYELRAAKALGAKNHSK